MANVLAPFGFSLIGRQEGGSPTAGLTTRLISSSDSNPIYQGDPVFPLANGYVGYAAPGSIQVYGIAYNFQYLNTSVSRISFAPYWPGSGSGSNCTTGICADSAALFVVQSTGAAPITFANIDENIQYVLGTGSTVTGISGASVDQGSFGTSGTLPFRVVGLWSQFAPAGSPGTDDTSVNNWVVVAFNNQYFKQLTSVA